NLLDTWHVSGMKASGSGHFEVQDLFVPESMTCDPFAPRTGDHPLLRFPLFGALGIGIGAVALGLAGATLREFTHLAGSKTPQGSSRPLALKSATQRRVALARATLDAARLLFYHAIEQAWAAVSEGGEASLAQRADLRLANSYAVQQATEVVDSLYTLAGGSSVYLNSPLQRYFRDIHVATQHMMINETSLELVGRVALGVETNTAQL
ncbi:MAG: acyl-CoA dehydrogenase family protein, partial [Pseudomonadota bacterium]